MYTSIGVQLFFVIPWIYLLNYPADVYGICLKMSDLEELIN